MSPPPARRAGGTSVASAAATMPLLFAAITAESTRASGPDLTRYFLVCALLVATLGALAFGFKRLVAGTVRTNAAKRSLTVVDVLPLGGKQRLCVVRCYDRTFALGLGEKEVSVIAELDAALASAPSKPDERRGSFAELLAAVRGRAKAEGET